MDRVEWFFREVAAARTFLFVHGSAARSAIGTPVSASSARRATLARSIVPRERHLACLQERHA
jgi:hypothetical protein